jgi:serine/threonine protein phosphatase PrpC
VPQEAVNFVRLRLSEDSNLQRAATLLTGEAISKGTADNVSVVIMAFHLKRSQE